MDKKNIRNICIIAHVDHGKTTLVDFMLTQSGTQISEERTMDSIDLEKEKGITIAAKNAAIFVDNTKINIVDTPGHADFGGEVERILSSVEGAVLLIDAAEGPMPQTRFVLEKSIAMGHKIILFINKVDRKEVKDDLAQIEHVVDKTFDLFTELHASDEQCDFPILYSCARAGWCTADQNDIAPILAGEKQGSLQPLFDLIIKTIPEPPAEKESPFKMLISNISWSDYLGQMGIGKIGAGVVTKGQKIYLYGKPSEDAKEGDENKALPFNVKALFQFKGTKTEEVESLEAGDIGVMAGCGEIDIGDSIVGDLSTAPYERISVELPTLRMIFTINTSPLAGKDGDAVQVRKLRDRILKECRINVALKFEETETPEQFCILGRGELQFAILIEKLRRENLEFMVGRPTVVLRKNPKGDLEEPLERVTALIPEEFSGSVTELFQMRKGLLKSYEVAAAGRVKLIFEIPTRRFIGLRSRFLTITKGEGIMSSELIGFQPYTGVALHRINGSMVADREGKTTEYALSNLESRGKFFIEAGVETYEGMVVGECNQENDINVNCVRPKKLTNIRTVASDGLTILAGVRKLSLEEFIEWIDEDEWIECTPKVIRVRKKILAGGRRSVIRGKK